MEAFLVVSSTIPLTPFSKGPGPASTLASCPSRGRGSKGLAFRGLWYRPLAVVAVVMGAGDGELLRPGDLPRPRLRLRAGVWLWFC